MLGYSIHIIGQIKGYDKIIIEAIIRQEKYVMMTQLQITFKVTRSAIMKFSGEKIFLNHL